MVNEISRKKISKSERTNAKNNENLKIVEATLDTIPHFNPVNPLITRAAFAEFAAGFAARMEATNEAVVAEDTAVEAQTAAFKVIRRRVTQILSAIKGQGVAVETLEHLMATIRRLRGTPAVRPAPDAPPAGGGQETPAPARRSTSQQSIAGILENLDRLDEQVKALPDYNPNEPEFKKEAITHWVVGLRDVRAARLTAEAATVLARHERDAFGYGKTTGLIFRMNTLKAYLETILAKTDPRYQRIKNLKFVDPTNK